MRRELIAGRLAAVLIGALMAVAGCSGASPLTGTSTPVGASSAAPAASASAPAGTASAPAGPSSQGPSAPDGLGTTGPGSGLSAACDATLRAQVVIATLFTGPVDGHQLTAQDVTKAFAKIGVDIPVGLQDDVDTLHSAAERAVGKSADDVAAILAEPPVSSAQAALAGFVRGCSPSTS